MTARHLVRKAGEVEADDYGPGFRRTPLVDETVAVHTGFGICDLEAGATVPAHLHSFEESIFVLSGEVVVETPEGAFRLRPGDYGLLPLGVAHAYRSEVGARWADMLAPTPRADHGGDTFPTPPLRGAPPVDVDPRDPRTRHFGHIDPVNMDPAQQNQENLAVSASMRTALLVYSGISVKMMVDSDLGAQLQTMFMVQYEPRGLAGTHDHPFEETYLILAGEVDATFDGERYRLVPGDVAWAGVGCVHGFSNPADRPVRWLETQAPQPPARHSYRFTRDWEYLRDRL
jgi:quercetin dioxygenase-like cupin family protein